MEATKRRQIKIGEQYDHFFPRAEVGVSTIRRNADVNDTVAFIPKVVGETLNQTKLLAAHLKTNDLYETCRNTWQFVYNHINYKKDEEGFEQIRSPARSWHDRKKGVDCDCYSVFISSILTNLGIPHILRITKYHRDYFQHIYPVVPSGKKEIVLDCVTERFDYEVPYSEKKDYPMDLQYLNGIDGSEINNEPSLYPEGVSGMEELGKIVAQRFAKGVKRSSPVKAKVPMAFKKQKQVMMHKTASPGNHSLTNNPVKKNDSAIMPVVAKKQKGKFLNKLNKINPATVALRNGILASMKLNIKNVAKRLRWSYLTREEAVRKGIDPAKHDKLIATRQKLENIFYKAGGKVSNLKKAILKGKGNKDKAVHGLEGFEGYNEYANEYTPMPQLLGSDIYYSENVEGMEGLGQLGEPITLSTIAAASGVIAGIVGMLKQIGDIFSKKSKESEDFNEAKTDAPENNVALPAASSGEVFKPVAERTSETAMPDNSEVVNTVRRNTPANINNQDDKEEGSEQKETAANSNAAGNSNTKAGAADDSKESFWDKNKQWIKPVAIGVGSISLIAIGISLLKNTKQQNKASPGNALNGPPNKRKKNHHRKTKYPYKKSVALL